MNPTTIAINLSNLSLDEINLILNSLSELPFKVSSQLIAKISDSAQKQIDAAHMPAPTAEDVVAS